MHHVVTVSAKRTADPGIQPIVIAKGGHWSRVVNDDESRAELAIHFPELKIADPTVLSVVLDTAHAIHGGPLITRFHHASSRSLSNQVTRLFLHFADCVVQGRDDEAQTESSQAGQDIDEWLLCTNPARTLKSDHVFAGDASSAAPSFRDLPPRHRRAGDWLHLCRGRRAAKHFPGHGDTATDSHTGLPIIDHTRAEWEQLDAPPFQAAIDARRRRDHDRAHRRCPRSTRPATRPPCPSRSSPASCARSWATTASSSPTRSAWQGVQRRVRRRPRPGAGAEGRRRQAPDAAGARPRLQRGARRRASPASSPSSGSTSSVRRILDLKQDAASSRTRSSTTAERPRPGRHPRAPGRRPGDHRPHRHAGPQRRRRCCRCHPDSRPECWSPAGASAPRRPWPAGLAARGAEHRRCSRPALNPTEAQIAQAGAAAPEHDLIVVLDQQGRGWTRTRSRRTLVKRLLATGKPVVAVAVRDPYDVDQFPKRADLPRDLLLHRGVSMESLAEVLFGEVDPTGTLPVTIPRPGPAHGALPLRPRTGVLSMTPSGLDRAQASCTAPPAPRRAPLGRCRHRRRRQPPAPPRRSRRPPAAAGSSPAFEALDRDGYRPGGRPAGRADLATPPASCPTCATWST